MAKEFRKGKALIAEDAKSKGGGKRRFTPNIYWKDGDVKTIAWLTAADDIPKVLLHRMVRVPDDRFEQGFRYETFLCKKDPSMIEESGGECALCDQKGYVPEEQYVALAVELEPVKEGKRITSLKIKSDHVKKDDGTENDYPRWGMVIQKSSNFFSFYAAYDEENGDIREYAWTISREGASRDTKYHPSVVLNGATVVSLPDLTELIDNIPSLEDLLEEMGSDEKYEQTNEVAEGSQQKFGSKAVPHADGLIPSGDRATEFANIKEEVVGKY